MKTQSGSIAQKEQRKAERLKAIAGGLVIFAVGAMVVSALVALQKERDVSHAMKVPATLALASAAAYVYVQKRALALKQPTQPPRDPR
jgi:hypothetical protein